MILKVLAGLLAVSLLVIYLIPPVYKLKDIELGAVVAIGLVMMLVDLVQSLRKDD
jgi:uncharacterized membrane protein YqjE